jgi:hypothetical protein
MRLFKRDKVPRHASMRRTMPTGGPESLARMAEAPTRYIFRLVGDRRAMASFEPSMRL